MTRAATAAPAAPVAAVLDAVLVVAFAAVGRQTHDEAWTGAFVTAAPFLVGTLLGWLIFLAWRRTPPVSLSGGVVVWLVTVAGGMAVRQLTGQGTALTFVVVSLVVTGALLLGWRALAVLIARRR